MDFLVSPPVTYAISQVCTHTHIHTHIHTRTHVPTDAEYDSVCDVDVVFAFDVSSGISEYRFRYGVQVVKDFTHVSTEVPSQVLPPYTPLVTTPSPTPSATPSPISSHIYLLNELTLKLIGC